MKSNSAPSSDVVTVIEGRDVTRAELSVAFDWVADPTNWKNPIDATLALSDRQAALVAEAIVFFCGCRPTMRRIDDTHVHIRAAGYYLTIGA